MKLAVLTRRVDVVSLRIYREALLQELKTLGIKLIAFPEAGPIPTKCDLIWEPGLGMRRVPRILKHTRIPVVGTMHGVRAFSLPINELAGSWRERCQEHLNKLKIAYDWRWFRTKLSAVIAVSKFSAAEVVSAFGLPKTIVCPIYHGVEHQVFKVNGHVQNAERPYFLHVSVYQPKKNVIRIIDAYSTLTESNRPDLVAILPGYLGKTVNIKGIKLIRKPLLPTELARWYRGALGFVFPSLHETFGLPILEAMACGCPVITSNITACPEVAGDAALLVDPRSINDIASALLRLAEHESLRKCLRQKGLRRAAQFTWRKSAEKHLQVFERVLNER